MVRQNEFNPDKTYIEKEMIKTRKPVIDPDRGMINPPILVISKDTLTKIKDNKND